ncbi:sugar phosphate isomerase/epimerase family protein [Lacticaseibacillus kribbianus]|uniref:sugar phosphate isomerase/epimerase family protein n=1 Tax=Lacticaseibacillus kribbianus TaxID=2926292 RepID=UPI001CD6B35D|nr:sugar phosphate isomerase/epimerase [Lacticaseibacillus kribbianus]
MTISMGMYSVWDTYQKDPAHTLHRLSAAGVRQVEMYGDPLMPAADLRRLLAHEQLTLTGWHVEWRLLQPDVLAATIAYHQACGNADLIIPALGGPWEVGHRQSENTPAVWSRHAARIREIQAAVEGVGMHLGYHTHTYDFGERLADGRTSLEILLAETDPNFAIEVDTGGAIEAGTDPVAWLNRVGRRARYVHCKPYGAEAGLNTVLAGPDDANDWPAILAAAAQEETRSLVYETEQTTRGDQVAVALADLTRLAKFQQPQS